MKNGYTNTEDRVSFSVEIVRCNPDEGDICKPETEVTKVLQ